MAFLIGRIANTHGVKGEIKVYPTTDDPSRFELLETATVRGAKGEKSFRIENVRYQKQMVILKLAGIDDMTAAEGLKGSDIIIPDELALPLGEDEWYARDLYDMDVFLEDGGRLGVLSDIIFTGANDVYVVKTAAGKELLLPAIKQCVLSVDVPGRAMTVRLMEGLES